MATANLHPLVRDFAKSLSVTQPTFRISPSQIRVLNEPVQFLDLLLDMIRRANARIFISSLYIGSKEKQLISTLEKSLRDKPHLQVHLLLDLNRSTRPGESSTAKLLLPLLRQFPNQVHVSMFRSPSLRGVLAKLVPPRFNEGWGTWHAKIYGVDDEVMISGANLNKSYFTNRQDRYLHFSDHHPLAQYCFDFLKAASSFSFQLLPASSSSPISPGPHSYFKEDYLLSWPDARTHPHQIQDKVRATLTAFQRGYATASKDSPAEQTSLDDALIFPLMQAGQFGIREEEDAFRQLFNHLRSFMRSNPSASPLLDLTSGYFSLYQPYQEMILASPNVDCRIVASAPQANGFYGSAGISGRIPEGYTLYEQRFMQAVKKASRLWKRNPKSPIGGHGVLLSEWLRPGWTYHAKGIWLSPDSSSPPILTLFGSTNLNARSAHIDTELSFLMAIPSSTSHPQPQEEAQQTQTPSSLLSLFGLRQIFAEEISRIRAHTVDWEGGRRKVRFTTKILVWLIKGML